jgi:hypothetical protein
MINENVYINFMPGGEKVIFLDKRDPEITALCDKYNGLVNVKISKPVERGTEQQNRAAHALMSAYYTTGLHSAPGGYTLAEFKIYMKLQYGPVYEIDTPAGECRVPKSWSDYSKDERREFIDGIISEIHQSGAYAESAKIREIVEGMNEGKVWRVK